MEIDGKIRRVGIGKQVIDATAIERGSSADKAMHFVPFFEQELCEVRTILTRDAGNQCLLSGHTEMLEERDLGTNGQLKIDNGQLGRF